MSFKEQLNKIKENWVFIVLIIIVLVILLSLNNGTSFRGISQGNNFSKGGYSEEMYDIDSLGTVYSRSYTGNNQNFAVEQEVRKIIKNASITSQIKKGEFKDAEVKLKDIVSSTDSYLLSENSQMTSKKIYKGTYNIKVKAEKLDSVVNQLRGIGKIIYINLGASDVTGTYENKNIELEIEKERLQKYNVLYNDAKTSYNNKISLINIITKQERKIKYIEDSLKNIDQKVEYSNITFTIQEKSNYSNIVFVKFYNLLKVLVDSINSLLYILFAVLPWILIFILVRFIFLRFKKKHKKK